MNGSTEEIDDSPPPRDWLDPGSSLLRAESTVSTRKAACSPSRFPSVVLLLLKMGF